MAIKEVQRRRRKPPPQKTEGGAEETNEKAVSVLAQVMKGKTLAPRRILLYGVHGVGKSTFGAQAPKSIIVPTEDGLGEIDCSKLPLSKTYEQFMEFLKGLLHEPHSYKTVVVDTLDWLERLIWTVVCAVKIVDNIEDIGYAKGYTFALTQWREVLDALTALRDKRGMTIILTAHAKIERFENPETEAYDRYAPRLHKWASAIVQEWCDEVLFATYKVFTTTTDKGFGQKKAKGMGTGERIMRTTERPAHLAKNRLSMDDELSFSWKSYAKYLPKQQQRKRKRK